MDDCKTTDPIAEDQMEASNPLDANAIDASIAPEALPAETGGMTPVEQRYRAWLDAQVPYVPQPGCFSVLARGGRPADAVGAAGERGFSQDASNGTRPFLSVVMRTQGTRPDEIRRAWSGLAQQRDDDYELILVVHNAPSKAEGLLEMLDDMGGSLPGKATVVSVMGGSRSRPLNIGFYLARGTYIAVLDDDDYPLDNWVSGFREAAQGHLGRVLYCYTYVQRWTTEGGMHALAPVEEMYCRPFEAADLFIENRCPLCGCAFLRQVFQGIGISFDESLDVLEDWDFLLRAVSVCDLAIGTVPSSIYCFWDKKENARTACSEDVWLQNREVIRGKLDRMPILLPEGSARVLFREATGNRQQDVQAAGGLRRAPQERAVLFIDTGNGFNQVESLFGDFVMMDGPGNHMVFEGIAGHGAIRGLRLDPVGYGFVTLRGLRVAVEYASGENEQIGSERWITNGILLDGGTIVFLKNDPQVCFPIGGKSIDRVSAEFHLDSSVADDDIDRVLALSKDAAKQARKPWPWSR